MDRVSATKVLNKYWASADKFERLGHEQNNINYLVQAEHLRNNCKEIIEKVLNNEATKKRKG